MQAAFKRIRKGLWTRRGEWHPTFVYNQQQQDGAEYQHYMYSASNKPLCAGVTRHPRMNRAIANQIARVWDRWRQEYVLRHPGSYPTAQEVLTPVAKIAVFPIDDPSKIQWFEVSHA